MDKKIIPTIHNHNYGIEGNFERLFKFIILLIVVSGVINLFTLTANSDNNIYDSCVDACSERHFNDYEVGKNFNADRTIRKADTNRMIIYKPTIKEFDRTPCIISCNILIEELKK